jgi:hypothetical protein
MEHEFPPSNARKKPARVRHSTGDFLQAKNALWRLSHILLEIAKEQVDKEGAPERSLPGNQFQKTNRGEQRELTTDLDFNNGEVGL